MIGVILHASLEQWDAHRLHILWFGCLHHAGVGAGGCSGSRMWCLMCACTPYNSGCWKYSGELTLVSWSRLGAPATVYTRLTSFAASDSIKAQLQIKRGLAACATSLQCLFRLHGGACFVTGCM